MPAVTWLDVVKTQLAANPGKSVKDVVPEARKEWELIKSGKHPTKTKGKMVVKRKGKRKTKKASRRPHKGEPSKSRPGHLAFRTHKGDKYFHRDGHVIKKSYAPYTRRRKSCKQKYKACLKRSKKSHKKHTRKHTRKHKKSGKKTASPWIAHVKAVAKKQNISYKEALKVAAKSFKK